MPLINCPECGRSISDQAISCPNCGLPMKKEAAQKGRLGQAARSAVKSVPKPLRDPVKAVDLNDLLNDLSELPSHFSAGRTLNGLGTRTGGYVRIPGIPELGIVRKYFCVMFIPLIPLALYVVKDWSGTGGVFIGQISAANAAKYINMRKQSLATVAGGLFMLIIFATAICVVLLVVNAVR